MKALIRWPSRRRRSASSSSAPIAEFGLVREKIAQMTVDCFAAESAVWMVAHYIDSGCDDYSVEAAISKVFASDAMQRTAYEALQIAGGNGYMRELPYEQVHARCAHPADLRGHQRDPAPVHRALGLKDVGTSLKELQLGGRLHLQRPDQGLRRALGLCRTALVARHRRGRAIKVIARRWRPALRPLVGIYENYARATARVAETAAAQTRQGHLRAPVRAEARSPTS